MRLSLLVAVLLASLRLCAEPDLSPAENVERSEDRQVARAVELFEKGERQQAFAVLTRAVDSDKSNPKFRYVRGRLYALDRQHEKAIADFDEVLKVNPKAALAFQTRGEEQFKLGRFKESLADFDRYLDMTPLDRPQHWQRGIACYYAGRYEDGRKQFELHQAVNPNDVENAVWHFLCVTRASGLDEARRKLIRIEADRRIPMMAVYALFAEKGSADDVIKAVNVNTPSPAEMNQRLFYAHLYVGLYYEAIGDRKRAREHILKAADDDKADHYMGDVARVHAALLRKQPAAP
jgi:lipoprotein NlpI